MHLSDIYTNPNNPRTIKEAEFLSLVRSLRTLPDMLGLRPIVLDKNNVVMGGNMRYRAVDWIVGNPPAPGEKEALLWEGIRQTQNLPEAWVKKVSDFTPEQWQQFVIKDNINAGEWDYEMLANEWDTSELKEWGLNIPNFDNKKDTPPADETSDDDSYGDDTQGEQSHVRMVQLYMNAANIDLFKSMEESMREHFGTENTTDTVYKAVQAMYEQLQSQKLISHE